RRAAPDAEGGPGVTKELLAGICRGRGCGGEDVMNAYAKVGAFLVLGTLLSSEAFAEAKFSEWGPPVSLGCGGINSPSDDLGPGISKDGLSFYFASNRPAPGAPGGLDIYVAQRPSGDAPWGAPSNLGPAVNSPFTENAVSLSRDGHW